MICLTKQKNNHKPEKPNEKFHQIRKLKNQKPENYNEKFQSQKTWIMTYGRNLAYWLIIDNIVFLVCFVLLFYLASFFSNQSSWISTRTDVIRAQQKYVTDIVWLHKSPWHN